MEGKVPMNWGSGMAGQGESTGGSRNEVSGAADNVVQARDVQGGIHVYQAKTSTWPVPRQLPSDVSHFTGRAAELDRLDTLLDSPADDQAPTMVISAIAGAGGMGKTTLAVHWAHRVRDQFPDGELYVNLQGYGARPRVTPEQALDGFLHALGVSSEKIPQDVEARAGLYRSIVAGRRILMVLDNAAKADQVLPLLPGSPTCLVIVTSRSLLSGLMVRAGVERMALDVLTPDEATTLLREIIGSDRSDEEPAAVAELAKCCAYLPLALRIAAERVAARPHLTAADVVEDLAVEAQRLDVLAAEDDETAQVRAVFSWSYRALSTETARVFRMLGLHPGPTISVPAAAALVGSDPHVIGRQLDLLAGAHLLGQTARDRFQLHDLIRVYAAECAALEDGEDMCSLAVRRLFGWYMHSANSALEFLAPGVCRETLEFPLMGCTPAVFADFDEARAWHEKEAGNIRAVLTGRGYGILTSLDVSYLLLGLAGYGIGRVGELEDVDTAAIRKAIHSEKLAREAIGAAREKFISAMDLLIDEFETLLRIDGPSVARPLLNALVDMCGDLPELRRLKSQLEATLSEGASQDL
jgi:hypothetical protein